MTSLESQPSNAAAQTTELSQVDLFGTAPDRRERLHKALALKFSSAKNVLLVGAGGGNDAFSSMLPLEQLRLEFGLIPEKLSIAAMLPDVLDYQGTITTACENLVEITPQSTRSIRGKRLGAFPEPVMAAHREALGFDKLYGMRMTGGSKGIRDGVELLLRDYGFDLVLVCDVGGDLIATPSNTTVLSPQMDAYALSALRPLASLPDSRIVFAVFGLGTDGESSPAHLHQALRSIPAKVDGMFTPSAIDGLEKFYREQIEGNRVSRTTDRTLRSIRGEAFSEVVHTARMHTNPQPGITNMHQLEFRQVLAPEFAGRYFLFTDISGVDNPFEVECASSLEWFLRTQSNQLKYNNEMNGQSLSDINHTLGVGDALPPRSLYFATPSWRFTDTGREVIISDSVDSVINAVFDYAIVYADDIAAKAWPGIAHVDIGRGLVLIGKIIESAVVDALRHLSGAR